MIHDTLDTLIERVLKDEEANYDLLADTRHMSVSLAEERPADDHDAPWKPVTTLLIDPEGGRSLDQEEVVLSDHALGQMATDLGIPKRYFDRMRVEAPSLFKTNVHHWLYETPNRRMIRARENFQAPSTGRAWLSDRYRRLDNVEIAKRLLPEFDHLTEEVVFHNAAITDTKMYLRAVFPRLQADVKVGEPVQWGVQIKNSEVGAGMFAIESFILTLSCKNGMVANEVLKARHVGKRLDESLSSEAIEADDKAFWLAARDMLRAAISETEFHKVVSTLRSTTEGEVITQPIAATERLAKSFSLSEGEQEAVLLELAKAGDMSRWGALSAITAAAKSSESFDRRVEMEELGWSLAALPEREWAKLA